MTKVNKQLEAEGLATLSGRQARRFLTSCEISTGTTNPNPTDFTTDQLLAQSHWQKENREELADFDSNMPTKEQPRGAPKSYHPQIYLTATDKRYLLQLEKGIDSTFAGGFLT